VRSRVRGRRDKGRTIERTKREGGRGKVGGEWWRGKWGGEENGSPRAGHGKGGG